MKKVVVIGCGSAGLNVIKVLRQHMSVEVVVIDKKNYNLFQSLLYQAATGELDPGHIASPIRSLMSNLKTKLN